MKTAISISIEEDNLEWIMQQIGKTKQTRSQAINRCIRSCKTREKETKETKGEKQCPKCGSWETVKNGKEYRRAGARQRYKCKNKNCGYIWNEAIKQ